MNETPIIIPIKSNSNQEAPVQATSSATDNNSYPSNKPINISIDNYVSPFQSVFDTFKGMKELLQIIKLIKCIKKITNEIKTCNNITEKIIILFTN